MLAPLFAWLTSTQGVVVAGAIAAWFGAGSSVLDFAEKAIDVEHKVVAPHEQPAKIEERSE